ncbi:MAG: hypothetical protein IT356_00055 [Gemmatimonadaceae bacterium]|nr:hypothetical protein [Gemmatimonadaceae bacterium]
MAKLHDLDPQITVDAALRAYEYNQARLARALGLDRASVNEWVASGRMFLPALQAHRLQRLRPDLFGTSCQGAANECEAAAG